MAEEDVSPYTPQKFTGNQQAVHEGLVKLIRVKLGPDMSDLTDEEVLQAAHLAYAPDLPPEDFVSGAKVVMSEKMHDVLQKEADVRATKAGQEGLTSNLKLKNVHVGPTPIKGVEVSGVPGVEERKALGKQVKKVGEVLGKGLLQSFSTPITGLMEWVAAHGLTQEEVAPEVYETRFAGAAEQDKLEKEAIRRIARESLDTIGWGLGAGEVVHVIHIPGFTNLAARLASEGAGWGAMYEGIDASLAGESADNVAKRSFTGGLIGAGATLALGGSLAGLGRLVSRAMGEKAAQSIHATKAVSDFPPGGLTPGERIALSFQKDGALPEAVRPFAEMAQRGALTPQDAAIHILGNLGVVNDGPGVEALAKTLEPRSLVGPVMKDVALTVPEMTEKRLAVDAEHAAFVSKLRKMAVEASEAVADIRRRASEEKWGDPRVRANLAQEIPEPITLESGGEPILLGPGSRYVPDHTAALREAQERMPHVTVTRTPRSISGKMVAASYKIGEPAFNVTGHQYEVIGYTGNSKLVMRTKLPTGEWKYAVAGPTDVAPTPNGFLAAINRMEAGAKARLEAMQQPTLYSGFAPLEGGFEWVGIGTGKFARTMYLAAKAGLSREETYAMWAKDMADEMRAHGASKKVIFLPKMYSMIEADYGETISKIVLRDSALREGLYDAVERIKKNGWVGHDWYDNTYPKLLEMFGTPEEASKFADFLAITSANRNIDANVNLALQAFAMAQVGEVPAGFGPNIDAMFSRYAAEEARIKGQPAVRSFASAAGAPKVSAFVKNVRGADVNDVTLDVWMNRYLAGSEKMKVKEKEAAKEVIHEIAGREGMTPRQVQAAMWADARIAEQILGPISRGDKLEMTMGSFRPYEDVTANYLRKRGAFTTEASIIKSTRENGGGTFYAGTARAYDKPGFSVALGGEAFDAAKVMPNAVRKVTERYEPALKKIAAEAGMSLQFVTGTWIDEGKMHVEIGVIIPERERALRLGEIAKQQSIGQLGDGGAFVGVVPTTHEKPTTLSLTDAKKALKEWISGASNPNQ
jgi:hypothetical protein